MQAIGMFYAEAGHTIVTGNAYGADQAFALGANMVSPAQVQLCLPWQTYNSHAIIPPAECTDEAGAPAGDYPGNTIVLADNASVQQRELARQAHSGWDYVTDPTKRLLIRNVQICEDIEILLAHPNLNKDGWGGTGHTMRVAAILDIPVWMTNLWKWWNPAMGQAKVTA